MYKPNGQFLVGKLNGRRHLCFQRTTGELGASPTFSQDEAVANARKVTVPDCGTLERTFAEMMRAKGFIVTRSELVMSDTLGAAVERELFPAT